MRAPAALCAASLAAGAAGHGYVLSPPSRATYAIPGAAEGVAGSCALGVCYWFSQGCTIGCPACDDTNGPPFDHGGGFCPGKQGKATIPDSARTYNIGQPCGLNPWCAPGTAPLYSPCGFAGGGPNQYNVNGRTPPPGHKVGEDGRDLPELATKTTWQAGGVAEIQWSLIANHGGGYQYRLCPKSPRPTEECFQQTPLEFHGEHQWIQYCSQKGQYPSYAGTPISPKAPSAYTACAGNRTAIKAVKVTKGVHPKGSTWMRNPIPACAGTGGGAGHQQCGPTSGRSAFDYQFPPPGPDQTRPGQLLGGFGAGYCYVGTGVRTPDKNQCPTKKETLAATFQFNVVDKVVVPDVPPGEYIMSFRWDVEQTNQIWATCSDVTITAAGPTPPPAPPAAQMYACENSVCIADSTGVDKATCAMVCK